MSFDRAIEEIIQAAMARGEFENLKGAGKPQDHSEYFSMPEEDRLAFAVLKNSGFVPPEVGAAEGDRQPARPVERRPNGCGEARADETARRAAVGV